MNEFDNINGFLLDKGDNTLNSGNRSYKYGDGLFETMKVVNGELVFWEDHYERLQRGIDILKIAQGNFSKEKWKQEIDKLIYKNHYRFAKIRLSVFRDSPGLYTPMSNKLGFIIEGVRYDERGFSAVSNHLKVAIYRDVALPIDILSNIKSNSALPYVMAAIYKKEKGLDDVLLLNSKGEVCESSCSNVFIVKEGVISTPALESGCVAGVMRKNVLRYTANHNLELIEKSISVEELKAADEIFLTNVIKGIQIVESLHNKELSQDVALQIQEFFHSKEAITLS